MDAQLQAAVSDRSALDQTASKSDSEESSEESVKEEATEEVFASTKTA